MKTKPRSLRRAAMRGATLLFAASVAAKIAGVATIYVTGLVLTKNEFAIYAIAIAWGEMFGFLQNGGLHRFLLQRARSFESLYRPILGLSFLINLLWCVILVALAPLISRVYGAEGVTLLLVLYGISFLARTIPLLLRSYLLIQFRFAEVSILDIYSALLRNAGVIGLAVSGFGPSSFVLPVVCVGVFETVYLCLKRKDSWRPSLPRLRLFRAIIAPTIWIMLSLVAISFVLNGDYMVIGALSDQITVGVYFFGFQLTVAILSMFVQSLRTVYVPSFVALNDDRHRQGGAFLRALEMSAGLLFFIMFGMAAVADPAISWIWSGKWDAAILVVEVIAVASLARVVSPLARALLEARGRWRMLAKMTWLEGAGLMASAGIGAVSGGLHAIVFAVAMYLTLVGILYLIVVSRQTERPFGTVASAVLGVYAIAAISLIAAWGAAPLFAASQEAYVQILIKGSIFTASFVCLILLFKRTMFMTAWDGIRHWKRR